MAKSGFVVQYITYERDESGVIRRTHQEVRLSGAEREREYPYGEQLVGWPEGKVYWTREFGPANGVAVY